MSRCFAIAGSVLVMLVVFLGSAYGAYVTDNLIAYWPLDRSTINGGKVQDSINGYDLEINGNPKGCEGKINEALEFDGQADSLSNTADIASINDAVADGYTLAMWVLPRDLSRYQEIGGPQDGAGTRYTASFRVFDGASGFGFDLEAAAGQVRLTSNGQKTGEWYYLTGTYDGDVATFYINGEEIARDGGTSGDVADFDGVFICQDIVGGRNFEGAVDEVLIYNRALTPDEVLANYNSNVGMAATSDSYNLGMTWSQIKIQ